MKTLIAILAVFLSVTSAIAIGISDDITVGGLSSGAFFAVQMHISHSSTIKGCAVFAGGPYYCAQGSMITATTNCMGFGTGIDIPGIKQKISSYENEGKIDRALNLTDSKIFVFSGTLDTVVNQKVNKEAINLYSYFGADIKSKFDFPAAHTMPTVNNGNGCTTTTSPYIGKCNYDGAFESLKHLHSDIVTNEPGIYNQNNLYKIKQPGAQKAIMGSDAYVYVPEHCQGREAGCSLHVVFHGCMQTIKDIGTKFVELTGYNEVAETNNLVILYPQVSKSMIKNPNGCWDWWGYVNDDYANKQGKQISVVKETIENIQSGDAKLEKVFEDDEILNSFIQDFKS